MVTDLGTSRKIGTKIGAEIGTEIGTKIGSDLGAITEIGAEIGTLKTLKYCFDELDFNYDFRTAACATACKKVKSIGAIEKVKAGIASFFSYKKSQFHTFFTRLPCASLNYSIGRHKM